MGENRRAAFDAAPNPLVSIIIPAYNYASYLSRAIGSCLDQTYGNVEIIVVDDGSTDDTALVAREMGPGVVYLFQENSGVSSARNAGLARARGDFIIFLDADDCLENDAIEVRLKALQEWPDAEFVLTNAYSLKEGKKAFADDKGKDFVSDSMTRALLLRRLSFATCAVLMRREAAVRFSFPLHLSNGEDLVYFAKVFFRRKGVFLARPTAVTYSHPDSLRHRMEEIERQGDALVEAIFDDPYYEGALEDLKRQFAARRRLEFFRRFYRAGRRREARQCLTKAVVVDPRTLLKIDYFVKLLRLYLRRKR